MSPTIEDMIRQMITDLEEAKVDAVKAGRGNKSAGTRVRVGMSAVAKQCKAVRAAVLEQRS